MAQEILKDPYSFDFLTIREEYHEKELEDVLVRDITRFYELGHIVDRVLEDSGTEYGYVRRRNYE